MNAEKSEYLAHFYLHENTKYFKSNLSSDSMTWEIAGTRPHGRQHPDGTGSSVYVLNCFSLDKEFFRVIQTAIADKDEELGHYEFGIVLSRNDFAPSLVVDVCCHAGNPSEIPVMDLHRYDNPYRRFAIKPFNCCNVVRIEWPPTPVQHDPRLGIKIIDHHAHRQSLGGTLPQNAMIGVIVPETQVQEVSQVLRNKGLSEAFVCQLQDLESKVTRLSFEASRNIPKKRSDSLSVPASRLSDYMKWVKKRHG